MTHVSNFSFHLNFVFCSFDNIVWLFNHKVSHSPALFIGNLNFSQHTIAHCTKYPNFITALYEVVVAFADKIAINGVEKEVVENHEGIEWHSTVLQYENRDEHTVVEQMLRHSGIYKWLIFLDIKSWVDKVFFHTVYHSSSSVRSKTNGRLVGFEPILQIRNLMQNKKASKYEDLLVCNNILAGERVPSQNF